MKKLVLLQSRSSSKRLPFKALLKIKNLPLVNFIYERIKSKYYKTVVLTSNDKTDDYLSWLLKENKINYYRGSLNNVKKRFLDYTKKNNDKDIIVRVTADNIFVDSKIINKSINQLIKRKKDYLYTNPKLTGLPNGISVEVFRLKVLRENKDQSKLNREHVTNNFEKNLENIVYYKKLINKWKNVDCTIDYLNQYINLKEAFKKNKINLFDSWEKVVEKISHYKKDKYINYKKITLKTLKQKQINRSIKVKICKLKNETWNYGIKSQLDFFDKNSRISDMHNLMFLDDELIGYTALKKNFLIHKINNKFRKKYTFLHFDSFIIKQKYRGFNYGQILMSYNNNKIINLNLPSFLICNNQLKSFYSAHLWKLSSKSKYEINKKNTKLNLMLFYPAKNFLDYMKKPKSKLFINLFR